MKNPNLAKERDDTNTSSLNKENPRQDPSKSTKIQARLTRFEQKKTHNQAKSLRERERERDP